MKTLKDLLNSKKFQAALIGLAVTIAEAFIPALENVDLTSVLAVLIAYIIGQGIADFGKERAKIVNESLAAAGMAVVEEE